MRRIPKSRLGVAAVLALLLVACSDRDPTGPHGGLEGLEPQPIINGVDDFDRSAVAAIMVYQPTHPTSPGWRSTCSATLIHKRVLTTAGHCTQEIEARLQSGLYEAVWISFQQDPQAHFNTDPGVADPASGGWHAIESLHNNPDNPDFSDVEVLLAIYGEFHDSGAIVLRDDVKGIRPMKMPSRPGAVNKLLTKAGCIEAGPCELYAVGFGLMEFPITATPVQVRQSAPLLYKSIDPLFVTTFEDPPGSMFGAVCFGDSGGPVVLVKDNGRDRTIIAVISSPEDPFAFPCTDAAINYRVDTESHIDFIKGILQPLGGR